jgi:hypothetical protein
MFRRYLLTTMALVAGSAILAHAAPKDDVAAATQKLADSDNYSWTTTTVNNAQPPAGGGGGGGGGRGGFGGGGPTSGKAQKDGLLSISITGRGGAVTQAFVKGDKVAVNGDSGWQSASELTAAAGDAGGGGGGFNPATMTLMRVQQVKAPADQVKDWLGKIGDLTLADGAYSADLTADTAQALMPRFGGRGGAPPAGGAAPADAPAGPTYTGLKGTIQFWVTDGVLSKYAYHVTGTLSFNGNDRDIDRTTTTEITGVGSSPITVPDDAKAKLQ